MSRSQFKGLYINPIKIKNIKKKTKIFDKNTLILPEFVDRIFLVYNGKKHISLKIKENMVGFKFGDFIFTRAIYKYKKK